jgi:hypothetical protein
MNVFLRTYHAPLGNNTVLLPNYAILCNRFETIQTPSTSLWSHLSGLYPLCKFNSTMTISSHIYIILGYLLTISTPQLHNQIGKVALW